MKKQKSLWGRMFAGRIGRIGRIYAGRIYAGRIYASLQMLMVLLPMNLESQEFLNGVCRIENDRLIFRIDLNWSKTQVKVVSGKFDLDTLLLVRVLDGQADSLLLSGGWQLKKINNRIAELSKSMIPVPPTGPDVGKVINPLKLFLIDDVWMNPAGIPEPEPVNYGVNKFLRQDLFSFRDSIATFILPGYSDARQIILSGTFNEWSTMQTLMKKTDEGWIVNLALKPGKYAYKYIVDGRWTQDANNRLKENDLNGGYNSVVYCYNYRFKLDGFTDAKKVVLAGSFNGFSPKEIAMNRTDYGWDLPLYLSQGTYSYKFVVDGRWITDPDNPTVRPDGRGNFNSFMGIGDTTWFRLSGYQSAKNIILSGSFNGWNTAELSMVKTAGGWQLPYILAPGNYEYKYIADGRWMNDSANPYANGYGDQANSILAVHPNHTFVLDSFPGARRVAVSGSFNGWNKQGYRMARINNRWVLPLYLKPGKYTYKLIIDGQWILDPGNELWEDNEYNTGNSVLWVRN